MTLSQAEWVLQNEQADETRRLRKNALFVGLSLIAILVFQTVAGILLGGALNRAEAAMDSSTFARLTYYALYGAFYCLMLFVPVGIMALIFRRLPRVELSRGRLSAGDAMLLILFGMAFCVLANYVVNYWLQFVSVFGIEPYEGNYHNEGGWLPLVLNLFTYALLPALVEETVFRGWVLGALQPFGERRALVLSALIFGLMHGNLTQIPFAFLLGLAFGFMFLRTGRLWIGMVIHGLNNGMSVLLDYANANLGLSESAYATLQLTTFVALAAAGVVAALILRHRDTALTAPMQDRRSVVTTAQRARMMWLNPAVIVGVVALVAVTILGEVAM